MGLKIKLWVFLIVPLCAQAQLPNKRLGGESTLEIGTWNIEWFGSDQKGPSNDELQLENVVKNLEFLNFDVIGLEEIVDQTFFEKLVNETGYQGIRSDPNSKQQETALLWNPNAVELIEEKVILPSHKKTFAQRLPHLFSFKDKTGVLDDNFYVIVIHLKAHIPRSSIQAKEDSYKRRKESGVLLAEYIDKNLDMEKVFVIGDWNDDIDVSNYDSKETPFLSLINSGNYEFATSHLSWEGASSSKYGNVIDHILISNELFDTSYQTGIVYFSTYDKNYIETTSDHFPTYITMK